MDNAMEIAIGIVGGAAIIGLIIYCIYIVKLANIGKKYLIEHFEEVKTLSKKYANIAINYIEKLKVIDALLFTVSYNTTQNLIVSHYWQQKPNLLLSYIYQYDGFIKPKDKVNLILPNEEAAKKLTENTISELKNKILADNSWTDEYTLPSLIYFIIRNSIIEKFAWQSNDIIPKGRDNYNREHQKEQEEKRQSEQISVDYFENNLDKLNELTKKYSTAVFNYINNLETQNKGGSPYYSYGNDEYPTSNFFILPYWGTATKLLIGKFEFDGFKQLFLRKDIPDNIKKQIDLTDTLIQGLRNRIIESNDWGDNYSLSTVIYFVVRNNVIKYYHDYYLRKIAYETLEEYCNAILDDVKIPSNEKNDAFKITKTLYVYYFMYEKDIYASFSNTYNQINNEIERLTQDHLENSLFRTKTNHQTNFSVFSETIRLSNIERIDRMSGEEFEIFMEQFFTSKGFKVTRTPLSGDYGVDIIIENDFGKIGVQAKCYSNKVSLSAVQEVIGGLRHYNLSSGMVVTNNYFQASAIRLAADNNITLWDRDKLLEKIGD